VGAEALGKFIRVRRTQSGMGIHEAAAFCGMKIWEEGGNIDRNVRRQSISRHAAAERYLYPGIQLPPQAPRPSFSGAVKGYSG